MNLVKTILIVVIILTVTGCATAPKPDTQFLAKNFTVSLAQIPLLDREAILRVVAKEQSKDSPATQEKIRQVSEAAQTQAVADMRQAFEAFPNVHLISEPLTLPGELAGFPIVDREQPLAPDVLSKLRAVVGTDALLRFGISDYGLTPKAWRNGVITFEVVSTLGIAALAYAKPATRAIAGIYLVQETIEETAEAYTGFWALNEVYRPVRVEAELIDLGSGRTIWADAETGFSDRRLSRLYTTVSVQERHDQLRTALNEAIAKLARDFQQSVESIKAK